MPTTPPPFLYTMYLWQKDLLSFRTPTSADHVFSFLASSHHLSQTVETFELQRKRYKLNLVKLIWVSAKIHLKLVYCTLKWRFLQKKLESGKMADKCPWSFLQKYWKVINRQRAVIDWYTSSLTDEVTLSISTHKVTTLMSHGHDIWFLKLWLVLHSIPMRQALFEVVAKLS